MLRYIPSDDTYYSRYDKSENTEPIIFSFIPFDLSTFKKSSDKPNDNIEITYIGNVKLVYSIEDPTYFNWKCLCENLGSKRLDYPNLFKSKYYSKQIPENFTIENTTKYFKGLSRSDELYISTSMLELCMHRLNVYEFFEYKFYKLFNKSFTEYDNNFIVKNKIGELEGSGANKTINNMYNLSTWNNMTFTSCPDDNMIAVRDGLRVFTTKINCKLPNKFDSSAKLSSKIITKLTEYLSQKINEKILIDDKRVKTNTQKFCHWKLLLILMDNLFSFEFWNLMKQYSAIELELKDSSNIISSYQIDFNNSITEIINDRFAKTNHGDLEIMFERKTSYIHLRTTLIKIDEQRYENNITRFMKSNDMIEFISQCNDLYYPEENDQIYELNKECKYPAWFKLNNIESRFKGYYVHVDVFMFILMWFNELYAAKYIKVLNTLLHLSSIKNQTLNQMYKDLINQLTKEIEDKNNQIKELQNIIYAKNETIDNQSKLINTQSKRIQELEHTCVEIFKSEGSIKLSRVSDSTYKLQKANYPLLNDYKTILLSNTYTPDLTYRNIVSYISDFPQPYIQYLGNNKFNILDINKTTELINNILTGKVEFKVTEPINPNIDKQIEEYENLLNNDSLTIPELNRIKGKLYECECAKEYDAQLWNNASKFYLNQFRLTNLDIGCDLIDINNKILYQCKKYGSKLFNKDLETFYRTIDIFTKQDPEYDYYLIVNDMSIVSNEVKNKLKDDHIMLHISQ